jgi:predicted transcriptional regulator
MAQAVKIGLISRIDYGSPGFRRGLLELAFDRFREAKVHFTVLAGGLLSWKHLKQVMPRKKDDQPGFLDSIAKELSEIIPRFSKDPKDDTTKLYVMVSPAYDGRIGEFVVRRLAELRNDIRFYPKPSERFGRNTKSLAVLVPTKASWRSRYASTPVDGLLGEELRRSTQTVADVYAVGCYGVFVHRPKGESSCEYFAVPALHKLEEVTSAENQVGAVVLEMNDKTRVTNINFKDAVREERKLISVPAGLSEFEEKVFRQLQEGPRTVGMIEESLHEGREKVQKALKKLVSVRRRNYPKVCLDENSGRYDFDNSWLQNELRYPWDSSKDVEETIVGFACMHAGSVNTDYDFAQKKIPEIILAEKATALFGVGDFIEGLKHDLPLRKEVVSGSNYTCHEFMAAGMIANILITVMKSRLDKQFKEGKPTSPEEIEKLVNSSLIKFYYTRGNHDDWVEPLGFDPLVNFRYRLLEVLVDEIEKLFRDKELCLPNLKDIIGRKLVATDVFGNVCQMSTGFKTGFKHPCQGRAQTTSLRLQASLAAMRDCHIVVIGNFHTFAAMTQYDPNLGQRVGIQYGTLKHRSKFEENMNKVVDFGVGILRVTARDRRVVETQTMFNCEKTGLRTSYDDLLEGYRKKVSVS